MSKRASGRCPHDGKVILRQYGTAKSVASRMPGGARVYWCAQAGGYHVTHTDKAVYDRRRATTGGDA